MSLATAKALGYAGASPRDSIPYFMAFLSPSLGPVGLTQDAHRSLTYCMRPILVRISRARS